MKDEAKDIAILPTEAQAGPDGEAATKTLATKTPETKTPETKTPAKKKRVRSSKAKASDANAALEARIGHAFANRDLLGHALTHMSAAGGAYAKSYQRLEFLGDRVLGLAIAEMLYAAFHRGSEGGGISRVKRWKETLPNGVSYETLDCADNGYVDNTNVYTVPSGHFFMMGDNRDNSTDSRVQAAVGYVPFENIIGRAEIIFVSVGEGEQAWMFWRWPTAVRWNRIFSIVR